MMHYTNRNDRIHIITLDRFLLEDIGERLHDFPGLESVELVRPGVEGLVIKPEDIHKMARDTITSRLLILDVRTQTIARLQRTYRDIIGFNRADFNRHCYTVLVGDGPRNFFQAG